jgi:hypothetical protein
MAAIFVLIVRAGSNAKGAWTKQHPMDCEERLVEQASLVKGANKDAKVWVYRNLVKAL